MANSPKEYWEGVNADIDGMLGGIPSLTGFSHVSKVDLQGSRSFLAKLGIGKTDGRRRVANALEGGAGIGRITKGLLVQVADAVDAIEPVAKFVAPLQAVEGVRSVFNVGLEDWCPVEGTLYDLIWVQWCVGYLTNEQLVAFIKRCRTALNPDRGIMVVKENLSTSGSDASDEVDGSVTRTDSSFVSLFEEAGWRIIRTETQRGFVSQVPRKLLPVRSYALKPKEAADTDVPPSNLPLADLENCRSAQTDVDVCLFSARCLLMEGRRKLQDWAKGEGVLLHGVCPTEIPCQGAGMVACRRLEAGEDILHVPIRLVRSLHTVPGHVSRKLPSDTSIHALMAADLTINAMAELSLWRDSLPTLADFNTAIPFMWHKKLQELLPKPAKELLENQQHNFRRDWARVAKAFPHLQREDYLHSWLIVNTRSFYYLTPQTEKYPPIDRLALVPIADLFNHADTGCQVRFTPNGFVVSADCEYHAGQEIYISYGAHTNDYLLGEYGFVAMANRWDKICLDDVILPRLSSAQKELLRDRELLGPFLLDTKTVGCSKTQAAIRLLCPCSRPQREAFLDEGCGQHCQERINALLKSFLVEYLATIRKLVQEVAELQVGQSAQRELLGQRWRQIEVTVSQAIERL